ncbi:MAG TPA: STAS domain-containing protein [Casimicrobiaceae bacterium]|nr:STAS domain-containing protein [Casimicrobiaceae bacterium]
MNDARAEPARFDVTGDPPRWIVRGALTFEHAAEALEAAQGIELPASGRVDLSQAGPVDSSALALIFALQRRARAEQRALAFDGLPEELTSLARVYGVENLL